MKRRPAKERAHSEEREKREKREDRDADCAEPLPTLKAGREVGWIFKNGEAVAIERHECDHRNSEPAS